MELFSGEKNAEKDKTHNSSEMPGLWDGVPREFRGYPKAHIIITVQKPRTVGDFRLRKMALLETFIRLELPAEK